MKNVKQLTILLAFSIGSVLSFVAQADNTGSREIQRIQISSHGTGMVYFRNKDLQPWGGSGCPETTYARMPLAQTGAKEIINLAMASKLNGTTIRFYGTCVAN